MEMLNNAFEGADQFAKLMEKIEQGANDQRRLAGLGNPQMVKEVVLASSGYETRTQRRARERAESKAARKQLAKKAV